MNYTPIKKSRVGRKASSMLTIAEHNITFTALFREKYQVGEYILLYSDDDGFLCFKFCEEKTSDSYKIYGQKGSYFLQLSKWLKGMFPKGKYNVVERDGYFVTDCKINQV